MKKLFLILLVLGAAPAFAQIVQVPPCVPGTTCLLTTDNSFTGKNQFTKGAATGPVKVAQLPTAPLTGTRITVSDPSSSTDCGVGGGDGIVFPPHECYWNGTAWGGGGFNCGTTSNPGITIWNGTACIVDPNASDDGNGNLTAVSVTVGSLNTSGVGFTQTFQSQAAPNATFLANMGTGQMVWYGDSGTNKWTCLNKDGSSCSPGGAAFSGITAATNSNAGTFAASGNSWDFTGTTIFKMRVGAGLTSSANGDIGYDTTNKNWHAFGNAVDNFLGVFTAAGTYVANDCVKITSINPLVLADSGGACGGAGSASPLIFSCGSSVSSSATDFCGVGILSTSEVGTQLPVPRAGTVSNLQCRIGGSGLSSSQTLTITVRKGSAGIGSITSSSTAVTCALNSTNTFGCSDGTHNFAVAAGDVLDIQTVPANTPATGNVNCSVQLQ